MWNFNPPQAQSPLPGPLVHENQQPTATVQTHWSLRAGQNGTEVAPKPHSQMTVIIQPVRQFPGKCNSQGFFLSFDLTQNSPIKNGID